ncbi:hypothetical protein BMR86_18650, partial [Stenotrophomonas sp. KAs 5-3]
MVRADVGADRQWLQDAYAMEQEAETMMKAMASRIQNYPHLAAR